MIASINLALALINLFFVIDRYRHDGRIAWINAAAVVLCGGAFVLGGLQ